MLIEADVPLLPERLASILERIDLADDEVAVVLAEPAPADEVPLFGVVDDPDWLDLPGSALFFCVGVVDLKDGIRANGLLNITQEC